MLVQKTVRAKIFELTKIKEKKLSGEYRNFQLALRGKETDLYSATKQQAERVRRRILRNGGKQIHDNHPVILRRDCFRVERQNTRLSRWWAKVPVHGGSIWVPIQLPYNQEPLLGEDVRETKLIRRKGRWFLHITVQKSVWVEIPTDPEKVVVIGVDLGEANPAASVVLAGNRVREPGFHTTRVRAVRAHHNNLRKRIGRRKVKHALRVIKRIGNREQRIVEHQLHVASKSIVEQATRLRGEGFQPVIVVGDLKGVRKKRVRGETRCRRNNRKVHTMPSYRMKTLIMYKALWAEIPVVLINEACTSRTCHRCGATGAVRRRVFECPNCGEYNRDLNAAINIGNRFLGYILGNRAALAQPLTPTPNSELLVSAECDGRISRL